MFARGVCVCVALLLDSARRPVPGSWTGVGEFAGPALAGAGLVGAATRSRFSGGGSARGSRHGVARRDGRFPPLELLLKASERIRALRSGVGARPEPPRRFRLLRVLGRPAGGLRGGSRRPLTCPGRRRARRL